MKQKITDNAPACLSSIQLQYGSSVWPSPNYELKLKGLNDNVNLMDNNRAFYEFVNQSGVRWDHSGGYSLDEWLNETVFAWNLSEINPSKQMVVNLRFDGLNLSSTNPMQLFVLALYNQRVLIRFSDSLNYQTEISN